MEEIRKRRTQKPEMRVAQREAALRVIKEKKKKVAGEKKKVVKSAVVKGAAPVKAVKQAKIKGGRR
jgi:hypothetical protein